MIKPNYDLIIFFVSYYSSVPDKDKQVEARHERFQQMDYEYEVARVKTHTQRSFGLGFGSSFGPPSAPPPSSQPRQEPPK